MSRSVVKEVLVKAAPDVVWKALTEAEALTRWFPVEARVEPGLGGSIWLSWGDGGGGEAPITGWEPGRHLQWTESRGPVKLVVDFHLGPREGGTLVRLVQSGFGDGPDWDGEFHMVGTGWAYFMFHLQWYLNRHSGIPRNLIGRRDLVALSNQETFDRLMRLATDLEATPFVDSPSTHQAGFTIPSLNDAILFIEIEPGPKGPRAGFWLSTYGLKPETFASLKRTTEAAYEQMLGH
jgi:uncharacterized protein YndB with AHSA1/START domain